MASGDVVLEIASAGVEADDSRRVEGVLRQSTQFVGTGPSSAPGAYVLDLVRTMNVPNQETQFDMGKRYKITVTEV